MKVIILGMHRSGTSMLTNLFKDNGVYVGEDQALLTPNTDNLLGYGERNDIVEINDSFLVENNFSWYNIKDFDLEKCSASSKLKYKEKMKMIIKELSEKSSWVLKDPRLCLLLPLFLECFNDEERKGLKFIRIVRSPKEVAQSLTQRDNFLTITGIALWAKYNYEILKNLKGNNYHSVFYSDLLYNQEKEIPKLEKYLNNEITFSSINFDVKLRRNKSEISMNEYIENDYIQSLYKASINTNIEFKPCLNELLDLEYFLYIEKKSKINKDKLILEASDLLKSKTWKIAKKLRFFYYKLTFKKHSDLDDKSIINY